MDRKMIHRDRDEIIDKYIRDELSDHETELFEEHLLSCTECRNEIDERNRIVDSIARHAAAKIFQAGGGRVNQLKKRNRLIWYVAAAGVALVIGIFLLPNRNNPSSPSQSALKEIQKDTMKSPGQVDDAFYDQPEIHKENIITRPKQRVAYLTEFQVNPIYENQIGIHARAGNLRVESPPDSTECLSGSFVEFRYRSAETDSLWLVIFNNQGEILSEEKIASPHELHMQFPEGLYYWQLTNEEESLHVAKIYIRP